MIRIDESAARALVLGAQAHAGEILGLQPDERVSRAYSNSVLHHEVGYPLARVMFFPYNGSSWVSSRSWALFNLAKWTQTLEVVEKYLKVGGDGSLYKFRQSGHGRDEVSRYYTELYTNLANLIAKYDGILKIQYAKTKNYAVASTIALAGAVSLAAGGLFLVNSLITAGCVALFAGAFFALWNYGTYRDDTEVKRLCYELVGHRNANRTKTGLCEIVKRKLNEFPPCRDLNCTSADLADPLHRELPEIPLRTALDHCT